MSKRLPYTPNSTIRSALRLLWLRSRERLAALQRTGYCCEKCGKKQSKARGKECILEVHHVEGIDLWENTIKEVRKCLLHNPEKLQPLCKECHAKVKAHKDEPKTT